MTRIWFRLHCLLSFSRRPQGGGADLSSYGRWAVRIHHLRDERPARPGLPERIQHHSHRPVSPDGNTLTGALIVWFWHPDRVSFTITRTDATASNAPAPEARAITTVHERFHLLANSPVYENPNGASPVLAQLHLDRYVNVIGTTGERLQVRLRTGIVGFIPAQVATQVQTADPK